MGAHDPSVSKSETDMLRSPLTWALLGLVIERPSHGYEFAQRFRRIYDDTLGLNNPKNIYRLLETLIGHGLIEETKPSAKDKPARNHLPKPRYRATTHGQRAYADWLVAQLRQEFDQHRLFARQLAMLEPEDALDVLERYEREYLGEEAQETPSQPSHEAGIAEDLAQEDERLKLSTTLTWLQYARRELTQAIHERGSFIAGDRGPGLVLVEGCEGDESPVGGGEQEGSASGEVGDLTWGEDALALGVVADGVRVGRD